MKQDSARVTLVNKPGDYPGTPDDATRRQLADLFAYLCPQMPDPEIDASHAGIAIAALNPNLALQFAKLSVLIAVELPWCQRRDLRELAIQTVNLHFKCDYSFQARMPGAVAAGIGIEQQKALPVWQNSTLFSDEQRLVIEYTNSVVRGQVPGEIFARSVECYGEKGAVELTSLVAFWSFWALFLNALRPG